MESTEKRIFREVSESMISSKRLRDTFIDIKFRYDSQLPLTDKELRILRTIESKYSPFTR